MGYKQKTQGRDLGLCPFLSPYFSSNKRVHAYTKDLGKAPQFNVGHKPLSALDPLYGIFIHVNADQLHFIRKPSLRQLCRIRKAQLANILAAQIVPAIVFVLEHFTPLLTFSD
jgi:hypothetical protein